MFHANKMMYSCDPADWSNCMNKQHQEKQHKHEKYGEKIMSVVS